MGGNLLYFPYLAINDQFKDFIAFPKEIVTRKGIVSGINTSEYKVVDCVGGDTTLIIMFDSIITDINVNNSRYRCFRLNFVDSGNAGTKTIYYKFYMTDRDSLIIKNDSIIFQVP